MQMTKKQKALKAASMEDLELWYDQATYDLVHFANSEDEIAMMTGEINEIGKEIQDRIARGDD